MDRRFKLAYEKLVDGALEQISNRTRVERAVCLFYCKKCSEVKTLTFNIDNEDLKEQLIADINPSTQQAFKNGCTDCGGKIEYLGNVVFTVVSQIKTDEGKVHRVFVVAGKEFRKGINVRVWTMVREDDKINIAETEHDIQTMTNKFRIVVDESSFKREDASWWV